MLVLRIYHRLRARYRDSRKALYRLAVEKAMMEEPLDEIAAALRPKRWGDDGPILEVLIESIQHLRGRPFEDLCQAAVSLGLVDRQKEALGSRFRHTRGWAMEALGLLRARQAVVGILDILDREPQDMKLVALRALANIGDPAVLPYFLKEAAELPAPLIPRLASLMLEFGRAATPYVQDLIRRRPEAFDSRTTQELLREHAIALEEAP